MIYTLSQLKIILLEKIELITPTIDMIYQDLNSDNEYLNQMRKLFENDLQILKTILNIFGTNDNYSPFMLLRVIFEDFLRFWLMTKGEYYIETQKIPIMSENNPTEPASEEGVRLTFERWRNEAQGRDDILDLQPDYVNRKINIQVNIKGYQNKNEPNKIIPRYYFDYLDYDPLEFHLSGLAVSQTHTAIQETQFREMLQEIQRDRKKIMGIMYQFMRYDHKSLLLKQFIKANDFFDENTAEKITVHYNFLSRFIHLNKIRDEIDNISPLANNKIILIELGCFYTIHLLRHLCIIIRDFFSKYNPNFSTAIYNDTILLLEEIGKEFWFIDNEPTEFDKWYVSSRLTEIPNNINYHKFYYNDPLDRAKKAWVSNENHLLHSIES